jgi:hypothetical protein
MEEERMGSTSERESTEERTVYFEPAHYAPEEIEAVLSDGTHVKSSYQRGGRRLGFDQALPVGTLILLSGVRGWVVGSPGAVEGEDPPAGSGPPRPV